MTLEAIKAPTIFPTDAHALHKPNTNPRLKSKEFRKVVIVLPAEWVF